MSNEFDIDAEVSDDNRVSEVTDKNETDWFTDLLAWCGEHKAVVICSIVGLPLFLIWFGAKIFSTHTVEQVEVEVPAEEPYSDMVQVPVHTTVTTEYEWVPKE